MQHIDDACVTLCKRAVAEADMSPEKLRLGLMNLSSQSKHDTALHLLGEGEEPFKAVPSVLFQVKKALGRGYLDLGKKEESLSQFEQLVELKISPQDRGEAFLLVAEAQLRLFNIKAAEQAYAKASGLHRDQLNWQQRVLFLYVSSQLSHFKHRFAEATSSYYDYIIAVEKGARKDMQDMIEEEYCVMAGLCAFLSPCGHTIGAKRAIVNHPRIASIPVIQALCVAMQRYLLLDREVLETIAPVCLSIHYSPSMQYPDLNCLEVALLEHNITVIGRSYTSISIDRCSALCQFPPLQVISVLIVMVSEGRFQATIDEVEGFIYIPDDYDRNEKITKICAIIDALAAGPHNP